MVFAVYYYRRPCTVRGLFGSQVPGRQEYDVLVGWEPGGTDPAAYKLRRIFCESVRPGRKLFPHAPGPERGTYFSTIADGTNGFLCRISMTERACKAKRLEESRHAA